MFRTTMLNTMAQKVLGDLKLLRLREKNVPLATAQRSSNLLNFQPSTFTGKASIVCSLECSEAIRSSQKHNIRYPTRAS